MEKEIQETVNSLNLESTTESESPLTDKVFQAYIEAEIPKAFCDADMSMFSQGIFMETHNFRHNKQSGLFIHGPIGTGKTTLAVALMRRRIHKMLEYNDLWTIRNHIGRFVIVPDLIAEFRNSFSEGTLTTPEDIIHTMKNKPYLILDDIGAEHVKASSETNVTWVSETMYRIINSRYLNEKRTIFTSNLSLQALSAKIDDRIVSRIAGMSTVINLTGKDRRLS